MKNLSDEGFTTINPPLHVYAPEDEADTLRGYVLSQQQQGDDDEPFYVVRLTEAHDGVAAGELVAVQQCRSIRALAFMLPKFAQSSDGETEAEFAYEIVLQPYAKNGDRWRHLLHTRRVTAGAAAGAGRPIGLPPSWPMMAREGEPRPAPLAKRAPAKVVASSATSDDGKTTITTDAEGVVTKVVMQPGAEAAGAPQVDGPEGGGSEPTGEQ